VFLLIRILAIAAAAAAVMYGWHRIVAEPYEAKGRAEIQPKLDAALVANQKCGNSVADLTEKVKEQNDAAQQAVADGQARASAAAKALAAASQRAKALQSERDALDAILATPSAPVADPGACNAAYDLLRDFAERRLRYLSTITGGGEDGNGQSARADALHIR
jgi:hypothetical protein